MADPLTASNADDVVKTALKSEFSDLKIRLENLERLIREDLELDRRQKTDQPDGESKLDFLNSRIDNIQNDLQAIKFDLTEIQNQFGLLMQTMQSIKDEI